MWVQNLGFLDGLGVFVVRFWSKNLEWGGFEYQVVLGLDLARFWPNRFKVQSFWRGLKSFDVQFWWMNQGLSEFKV